MSNDLKIIRDALFAFLFMSLFIIAVGGLVYFEVGVRGSTVGEHSTIEFAQVIALLIISITFIYNTFAYKEFTGALSLVTGFFLSCAIRENDFFFDDLIVFSWKLPVAIVIVVAIFYAAMNRKTILPGLVDIAKGRHFPVLAIGFAILFFYSRIFGSKHIWSFVYSETTVRTIKNVAEEATELLGYAFMVIWAIFYTRDLIDKRTEIQTISES